MRMQTELKDTENDMSTEVPSVTVKVEDATSRDLQLEHATPILPTSILRERATDWSILVTRVDFTTFTIALSPDIPFGFTRELDLL